MKPYDNQHALDLDEEERLKQWEEVEGLVLTYQQYLDDPFERYKSQQAADLLLQKFSPLFKSYLTVIKYNQIDWSNKEQKLFVSQFIGDRHLKAFLTSSKKKKSSSETKAKIYEAFNFVAVTYGSLTEEDILSDLYMCFLILMKRYKQTGRNFCAYVANVYHYEVSRHIKKQTSNPLAINYKNYAYEDSINSDSIDNSYEDSYYELATGLPDYTWVNGETCSELFEDLSDLQRKILIEYYLEDYNDGQIGIHTATNIGTINSKRRKALKEVCDKLNIDPRSLPRQRKNGRK